MGKGRSEYILAHIRACSSLVPEPLIKIEYQTQFLRSCILVLWLRETLLTDTSVILLRSKEAMHHHHRRIVLRARRPGLVKMVGEGDNFLCRGSKNRVNEFGRRHCDVVPLMKECFHS